jgi:hypothetical protein
VLFYNFCVSEGRRQKFNEVVWTNKRYHQECGNFTRARKTKQWRERIAREPITPQCIKDYIEHPERIPTKRTHDFNAIVEAIIHSMRVLSNGIVERVYGLTKFLELRYIAHVKEQQTLEKLCDEIAGTKNHKKGREETLVVIGDACFSSTYRGNLPAPTKKLTKKIQSRFTTVMINEDRTSKACFRCDHKTFEHPRAQEFRFERLVASATGGGDAVEESKEMKLKNKRAAGYSRIRLCHHCLVGGTATTTEDSVSDDKLSQAGNKHTPRMF